MDKPKIHYFSLDVEGTELEILSTFPWDLIDIELMMIETKHSDEEAIIRLMEANGYTIYKRLKIDLLFAKSYH